MTKNNVALEKRPVKLKQLVLFNTRCGSRGAGPGPPIDPRFRGPKIEHFWALFNFSLIFFALLHLAYYFFNMLLFRWFKFTLKPPYTFGLFGSNLDTRDLETYPRTYSGHYWNMSIFDDSRAIWVLFRKWVVSENQSFLDEGVIVTPLSV